MRTGLADQFGVGRTVDAVAGKVQRDPAASYGVARPWWDTQGTIDLLRRFRPHSRPKCVLRVWHDSRNVGLTGWTLGPAGSDGTVEQSQKHVVTVDDADNFLIKIDFDHRRRSGFGQLPDQRGDESVTHFEIGDCQCRIQPTQQSSTAMVLFGQNLFERPMAEAIEFALGQPAGGTGPISSRCDDAIRNCPSTLDGSTLSALAVNESSWPVCLKPRTR